MTEMHDEPYPLYGTQGSFVLNGKILLIPPS